MTASKWRVLDDLRITAAIHGLGPGVLRSLQVLVGLIRPEQGDFTVFASNRTICDRLMGVSERTVQRHVRQLSAAGLLRRDDSASGRRFRQSDATCFGLNLQPLYDRAGDIAAEAAAETARREALRNRRRVLMARLYDLLPEGERRTALARDLRAARDLAELERLAAALPLTSTPADPDKMTRAPRQNAVSIQNTEKDSDSVYVPPREADMPLAQVLDVCPEVRATFGQEPRTWRDATAVAATISGFIGVTPAVWQQALGRMGPVTATTTLFLMLQRLPLIREPAAYLRGLIARFESGRLNLRAQVRALRHAAS